jgi:hypothetical protein
MSVYADGVAAYRDSTKWLVAFVPITTVATGLVAAGAPSFGRIRAQSETTLTHLVFAAILTTLALSAVMLSGTRVLDAEPESLSSLQKPKNRATLAKAISDGVIAPHFFDAEAFQKAMAQAQVDLSKAPPPAGLADQLSSLGAAVESCGSGPSSLEPGSSIGAFSASSVSGFSSSLPRWPTPLLRWTPVLHSPSRRRYR